MNVIMQADQEIQLIKYSGGCVDNLLIPLSVDLSNKQRNKEWNMYLSAAFKSVALYSQTCWFKMYIEWYRLYIMNLHIIL